MIVFNIIDKYTKLHDPNYNSLFCTRPTDLNIDNDPAFCPPMLESNKILRFVVDKHVKFDDKNYNDLSRITPACLNLHSDFDPLIHKVKNRQGSRYC